MNLFIYGSGGTGCEMVDTAERINRAKHRWDSIFFVDDIRVEPEHYHTKVFKFDQMLAEAEPFECIVALGEPVHRRRLYEILLQHQVKLATVVDVSVTISPTATIGAGCYIGPYCFVSSHTRLQDNIMLEIHTIVGHDIDIGKHCVISSGVVVGGSTSIGDETFVGLNSTIKERVRIGTHCIVGMHSAVFTDIDPGLIALGNPARVVRKNEEHSVFKR